MTKNGDANGRGRWETASPIRYPDPDVIALDPRFERLMLAHAAIQRIATGCRFTEGPAWFGDLRQLIFSDIPNDRLMRWDEETGRLPCSASRPDSRTAIRVIGRAG